MGYIFLQFPSFSLKNILSDFPFLLADVKYIQSRNHVGKRAKKADLECPSESSAWEKNQWAAFKE